MRVEVTLHPDTTPVSISQNIHKRGNRHSATHAVTKGPTVIQLFMQLQKGQPSFSCSCSYKRANRHSATHAVTKGTTGLFMYFIPQKGVPNISLQPTPHWPALTSRAPRRKTETYLHWPTIAQHHPAGEEGRGGGRWGVGVWRFLAKMKARSHAPVGSWVFRRVQNKEAEEKEKEGKGIPSLLKQ